MTTTDTGPSPLRITADAPERDQQRTIPFYLGDDDQVYEAERPPMAVLLDAITALGDDSNELAQVGAYRDFLREVLTPESHDQLWARFRDRSDPLDLDHPLVIKMIETLVETWYGGPTKRPSASARRQQRTGGRSTVRRR